MGSQMKNLGTADRMTNLDTLNTYYEKIQFQNSVPKNLLTLFLEKLLTFYIFITT